MPPAYPYRKLAKQFAGNANAFCTTNPDPDGTPLTLANATGRDSGHGQVTIMLTNGFTPSVTLTAFYWHIAKACWVRVGPAAANYQQAVDSHYTTWTFNLPPRCSFLIMSSAAVTGDVYTDAPHDPNNNNDG